MDNDEYESNSIVFVLTFIYLFIQLIYESTRILHLANQRRDYIVGCYSAIINYKACLEWR